MRICVPFILVLSFLAISKSLPKIEDFPEEPEMSDIPTDVPNWEITDKRGRIIKHPSMFSAVKRTPLALPVKQEPGDFKHVLITSGIYRGVNTQYLDKSAREGRPKMGESFRMIQEFSSEFDTPLISKMEKNPRVVIPDSDNPIIIIESGNYA